MEPIACQTAQFDGIGNKPRGTIRQVRPERLPDAGSGRRPYGFCRCRYRVCRANSDEEDSTFPYTITGKEDRGSALLGPVAVKI